MKISGFTISGATFHSKYGTATYIKNDLDWNHIRTSEENSIYTVETQVGNIYVTNISNHDYANKTLEALNNQRRERWLQLVEKTNFKHLSHNAWSLLQRLGSNGEPKPSYPSINPNHIANHIIGLSRASSHKQFSKETKTKLAKLKREADKRSPITAPFTLEEINSTIAKIKTGKLVGKDGIFPEFIKHCGVRTRSWLTAFFNNLLENGKIPATFKNTKIIAICKPKKPNDLPQNYRPIALLSVSYKLLERLIYNRISPIINQVVPKEQAGFRPHQSCKDQAAALTTFIENGFQKNLKTTAVLVDLTAAYDTVWRTGLLTKLLELIPCLTLNKLLKEMLSNRMFTVHLRQTHSKSRKLNDGLPQGSVLAPILFNPYISDLPMTISRNLFTLTILH